MVDGFAPIVRSARKELRWLAALAGLCVLAVILPAAAAFELPGEFNPDGAEKTGGATLPELKLTHIAPVATGFKPASVVKIKIALPDEPLKPGEVYTVSVTWTLPAKHHLNGPSADNPDIPFSRIRLIGDAITAAAESSYTGTLQASEFEGIAPYFHEATVTAALQFRIKPVAAEAAGAPNAENAKRVKASLEIDSSFCSESGRCYEFACTSNSGERYALEFQRDLSAVAAAAGEKPFAAVAKPPVTPKGSAPGGEAPPPPAGGSAAAAEPRAYKITRLAPVADQFKEPKDAQVRLELPDESLSPGQVYQARVTWTVGDGFHLNGPMADDPTAPASRFRLAAVNGTALETGPLEYTGTPVPNPVQGAAPYFREKTVTATLPFRVNAQAAGFKPGELAAVLDIDTSYCTEAGKCYYYTGEMKRGQRFAVTFAVSATTVPLQPFTPAAGAPVATVAAGAGSGAAAEPTTLWGIVTSDQSMKRKVELLFEQGGWPVLCLFVLVFGVLTTGLPCTYPLIPITSRILGAPAPGKTPQPGDSTRGDAFAASLFYMLGLTVIYGVLGGSAAVAGQQSSAWITDLNNSAWFNYGIAILFLVLALGMYGWFEIKMPTAIANKLQGAPRGPGSTRMAGMVGNAFRGLSMGSLAALLAGACTAPIVIAAIVLIAKLGATAGFGMGFLILAPFGLGFGIPYFLLTNFVSKLPAPGRWMELLKILFGTVILLCAFYFWNNTVPSPALFAAALGVTLLAVGLGYGAFDRPTPPVAVTDRVRQMATLGIAIAGGYFLVTGLSLGFGFNTATPATGTAAVKWESHTTYDPAQPDATGRPVFIFFHSPSCQYCKKMLATGFRDPEVVALTAKIRMIDADAQYTDAKLNVLQEKYQFFAQPTCVFLNAEQQPALGADSTVEGYIDTAGLKDRFTKMLEK